MWLINTSTLSLELFYGDDTPAYAILSHTWGQDELSLQEFRHLNADNKHRFTHRAGYQKVIETCQLAQKDRLLYVWIDTCCIDKTSSADLTEAINSMFSWYREAQVCYAYLSDVQISPRPDDAPSRHMDQVDAAFRACRWFTRGWCLQELLAPRCLRFYDGTWRGIGERDSLSHLIARMTGIPETLLVSSAESDMHDFPVATRISWIARRRTTRVEDMSYSLLGILDINMPMLYGEGPRAFHRLQEEVIRKYNDLSIFAWTGPTTSTAGGFLPALAAAPSSFIRDVGQSTDQSTGQAQDHDNPPGSRATTQFALTNQGVVFPAAKLYSQHPRGPFRHHYVLYLDDHRYPLQRDAIIAHRRYMLLQKVGPGLFARLQETPDRVAAFRGRPVVDPCWEPVCVVNHLTAPLVKQLAMWERHAVRLRWRSWNHGRQKFWHIRAVEPQGNWDRVGGQFLLEMAAEQFMHLEFAPGEYATNPGLECFVLVIQVGDGKRRNTRSVSAHIVDGAVWPGVSATPFRFAFKENLALRAMDRARGDDGASHRISMVGYDIVVSVELVEQSDGVPYHSVYLDWTRSPRSDKNSDG